MAASSTSSSNLRNRKKKEDDSPPEPVVSIIEEEEPSTGSKSSNIHRGPPSETSFHLIPLIQLPIYGRLDVLPFALLYGLLIGSDVYLQNLQEDVALDEKENADLSRFLLSIVFALALLGHLGLVLACQWNVSFQTLVGYKIATSIPSNKWTHCFVKSKNSSDEKGIVAISQCTSNSEKNKQGAVVVNFHDRIFRYATQLPDEDTSLWLPQKEQVPAAKPAFQPLRYPIDLPLSFFASWQGHMSLKSVTQAANLYGPNQMMLKLPTLTDLLMEQLVAPFFLFQVFCVTLWSLDEYWYYALFTLAALLMFETTMAYNRLQSLQRLHEAGQRNMHQRVYVRRGATGTKKNASWMLVKTHELVPGDCVSIAASGGHPVPIPADILLIEGTAVCDEALLTGESIPQLKHPLELNEASGGDVDTNKTAFLDCQDGLHKESILFGGTNALVTTGTGEDLAPDHGVLGIVLRTGFATTQGNLLRTMAHAHKVDGVHTWDTFVFILLLIAFAIGAAAYVLHVGWQDDRRNRFRLILHVILIVTSVVPPELPMELSLAVTNSFAALVRRAQVYCTELYRIPWAGQVDVCCFDKTGTLTSDEVRTITKRIDSF